MKLIQRLPVFATGLGLACAVVLVADARHWSGLLTALVAASVGVFFVVAILVPVLIREQLPPKTQASSEEELARLRLLLEEGRIGNDAFPARVLLRFGAREARDIVSLEFESPSELAPETAGPPLIPESRRQVATG